MFTPGIISYSSIESPNIILKVVTSAPGQKIGINKYFHGSNYTIDWGDGTTTTATTTNSSGAHSKTYASAGTYYITLVSTGFRWIFTAVFSSLVPISGFTGQSVGIVSMPSLKDWFGANSTNVGDYFFNNFNLSGALSFLPSGSFDTSNIVTSGTNIFNAFNRSGKLTSLPDGSFSFGSLTNIGNNSFYAFNIYGNLTSLPAGSFNINNLTSVLVQFLSYFNYFGALTSLPAGSFNTTNITSVGANFMIAFNESGNITKVASGTGVSIKNVSSGNVTFHYSGGGPDTVTAGGTFDGYAKS